MYKTGYTFESSRKMTKREQDAYDMGYEIGKRDAVRHGKWEKAKYIEAPVYVCSECGNREPLPRKFCPECGAMMDGER